MYLAVNCVHWTSISIRAKQTWEQEKQVQRVRQSCWFVLHSQQEHQFALPPCSSWFRTRSHLPCQFLNGHGNSTVPSKTVCECAEERESNQLTTAFHGGLGTGVVLRQLLMAVLMVPSLQKKILLLKCIWLTLMTEKSSQTTLRPLNSSSQISGCCLCLCGLLFNKDPRGSHDSQSTPGRRVTWYLPTLVKLLGSYRWEAIYESKYRYFPGSK